MSVPSARVSRTFVGVITDPSLKTLRSHTMSYPFGSEVHLYGGIRAPEERWCLHLYGPPSGLISGPVSGDGFLISLVIIRVI